MTYESPLVTYCKERGLKLDRETYIAGCYPDGAPDPWTPEDESHAPAGVSMGRQGSAAARVLGLLARAMGSLISPPTTPLASTARCRGRRA